MTILVTGGAGYIGSHTVSKLLGAGYEVVVYDNFSTGFQAAVSSKCAIVVGDVRDRSKLSQVIKERKIDGVIHFAAKLNIAESLRNPIEYYDNNTMGTVSLVRACTENNVKKVVFSSTAAVYGNQEFGESLTEMAAIKPINPYGFSKYFGEKILCDQEQVSGLRSVRLRYFNVAGASQDGSNGQRTANAYHLIHLASQVATGKLEKLTVFGTDYPTHDGTCIRDYIHVEDLADIHVLAFRYLEAGGSSDVFNCGYGKGWSVLEVISAFKKATGIDFPVVLGSRRAGDPASLIASSQKLQEILGWKPRRADLDLICRSAYQWESFLSQK